MKESIDADAFTKQQGFQDENHSPEYRPVRKRRLVHFVQMLAAVLVVGALLAGFLVLLSSRHAIIKGPSTGTPTNAPSIVAVSSFNGTVYALRPQDGTALWHYATGIVDSSVGSDSSLAVLNHVVYFAVRGQVFAFRASEGKMLWHQNVLSASAHVFGSDTYNFALDGDVLLVRLANDGGNTSILVALRASSGGILWHYEMNVQYVMTASHGIVYVGSTDAMGDNQTLLALRSTDGKELWSRHNNTNLIAAVVVDKVLYVQANVYDEPVTNNTQIYQSLSALNAITGGLIWSRTIHTNPLAESLSNQGLLLSKNGAIILFTGYQFCAYSSTAGAQLWCSHDFVQRPTSVSSNTIINAGFPDFYALAGQTLTTTSISLHTSLDRNNFSLTIESLSLNTGKTLWTRDLDFKTASNGIMVGIGGALTGGDTSSAYAVAGEDIYSMNSSNGHVLWHIRSSAAGIAGLMVD